MDGPQAKFDPNWWIVLVGIIGIYEQVLFIYLFIIQNHLNLMSDYALANAESYCVSNNDVPGVPKLCKCDYEC